MPWQHSASTPTPDLGTSPAWRDFALYADPLRLDQALGICYNAIKYTPTGKVAVISETEQNHILSVRYRPRYLKDEQEAIFTPLYRSAAQRDHASGMGLGLSIARNLIAAHKRTLTVESELGHSTFIISLPNFHQVAFSQLLR
jgi:signal transduction histidine kinase